MCTRDAFSVPVSHVLGLCISAGRNRTTQQGSSRARLGLLQASCRVCSPSTFPGPVCRFLAKETNRRQEAYSRTIELGKGVEPLFLSHMESKGLQMWRGTWRVAPWPGKAPHPGLGRWPGPPTCCTLQPVLVPCVSVS